MIAGQREAEAVIPQSNRRLVQERDLTSHTQSLLWVSDQLRRQSHPFKKSPNSSSEAGIGRSQYSGSSVTFTARETACFRANYASTLAMQRCADQAHARLVAGSGWGKKARRR